MLCKSRQVKSESAQVYAERLYALANDAFANLGKAVVESQLVGFFIDGLYHDFLHMKVMRKSKNILGCSAICIGRTKLWKGFQLKSNEHDNPKGRTEEQMEIDHIKISKKMFPMMQGDIWQNTVSLDQLVQ